MRDKTSMTRHAGSSCARDWIAVGGSVIAVGAERWARGSLGKDRSQDGAVSSDAERRQQVQRLCELRAAGCLQDRVRRHHPNGWCIAFAPKQSTHLWPGGPALPARPSDLLRRFDLQSERLRRSPSPHRPACARPRVTDAPPSAPESPSPCWRRTGVCKHRCGRSRSSPSGNHRRGPSRAGGKLPCSGSR